MSKQIALTCRWACPPGRVTFDPSHVLPWAWQDAGCSRFERKAESGGERVWLCEGCVAQPIRKM